MRARGWLGAGWAVAVGMAAASEEAPVAKYRAIEESVRAEIQIVRPPKTLRGVLVLANATSSGPRAEPSPGWQMFARNNSLALCLVNLDVAPVDPAHEPMNGIIPPTNWLEARTPEALLEAALEQAKLAELPRALYGFRSGANMVLRLLSTPERRILAWGCHAATAFPSPRRDIPYGLVAASDLDEEYYDLARDYVEELRRRGTDVAWVSLPGSIGANEEFQVLVRQSMATMIEKKGRPVVMDNASGAERPRNLSGADAATTSVLASKRESETWSELHRPAQVLTTKVATGLAEFPELGLALRLPSKQKRDRVLAYCYHSQVSG